MQYVFLNMNNFTTMNWIEGTVFGNVPYLIPISLADPGSEYVQLVDVSFELGLNIYLPKKDYACRQEQDDLNVSFGE